MSADPQFVIVPLELVQDRRLTLMQSRVLMTLFSFRRKNTDTVWPTRKAIVERCGYSPAVVSRVTSELVALGWLIKHGSGRTATVYQISVPDIHAGTTVTEPVTVTESVTVTDPETQQLPNRSLNGYRTGNPSKENRSRTDQEQIILEVRTASPRAATGVKPAGPNTASGMRLPDDWQPDDDLIAWAQAKGASTQHIEDQTERFRNYWLDKPGAAGRKVGWSRTWQNWITKSLEDAHRGKNGQHRKQDIDFDDTSWYDPERARRAWEYGQKQRQSDK